MASHKSLSRALSTAALALSLTGLAHGQQEGTETQQPAPASSAPAASAPAPAPRTDQNPDADNARSKCGLSWRNALGAIVSSGLDKHTRSAGAGDMAQIIISPGCSRKLER